ncbi:hypothetical protein [Flavobacterium sp.]|uniref:hypothetical protein n=1 Tax=Flavobacterium sp. TaxID=239 RepID=UPI001212D631|nr:hypothetical protein [Flavobacterium sp.]RZJ72046.1 MAG: hypothetical protein EOO49_08445 [Flavobacterium sp.]
MKNCVSDPKRFSHPKRLREFFSFPNFQGCQVATNDLPLGIFGSFVARQKNSPPDRRRKKIKACGSAAAEKKQNKRSLFI